jgi:DNA-binding NarL/FixJ family response regulator
MLEGKLMLGFPGDGNEMGVGIATEAPLHGGRPNVNLVPDHLQLIFGVPPSTTARLNLIADLYAEGRGLSEREREVFKRFVLEGMPSKQIAVDLGIAYPTVKLYWTRIFRKLGCSDAIAVTVAFLREIVASYECPDCGRQRVSLPPEERLLRLARAFAAQRQLSARETEVFTGFVSRGKASKEIAVELGIAYPTVKLYWTRICRKLECDHATGALRTFLREAIEQLSCRELGRLYAV